MKQIRGSRIKIGTRVKLWFMSNGTTAVSVRDYNGPLAHLWPNGARIIGFVSNTKRGITEMTVPNNDLFEKAA
jgi:hypothetical protein